MHPIPAQQGFKISPDDKHSLLFSPEDMVCMLSKKVLNFDRSDHRNVFYLPSVHFKLALSREDPDF